MTSSSWKGVADLIGVTAIVASLLFVGLQLKQSQEIAIAGQYQERTAVALEYWNTYGEDDWFINITGQGELDNHGEVASLYPTATAEDIGRLNVAYQKAILVYDNHLFQFESGFMTDEAWIFQRDRFKETAMDPYFQHLMEEHKAHVRPLFLDLCNQLRDQVLRDK